MTSTRLSVEHLDRLISSIRDRFGIVMASDPLKARERASALVRDMSQDLDEKQDRVFAWIMERSDQAFVELISPYITVGETYFFRDRKTLNSFREEILSSLASSTKRPIKVWSAGCSTGEEPYTLAMIMEDSTLGLGGGFRVYGTDLNENSLKKAQKGVYGRWSFRGMNNSEIARYFDPFEDGFFQVKERYRSEVSFGSANLVASILPWRNGEIDVIFCRNVIMYFDDDSRKKVLEGFMDALSPDGWLVVAACETSLLDGSPFHPIHMEGQTFFRPTDVVQRFCPFTSKIWTPSEDLSWDDDNHDYGVVEEELPPFYSPFPEDPSDKEVEPDTVPSVDIDVIRSLADRGERERALELCLSLGNSTDPYVHYLTSIIYQDIGNLAEAKERLRKTLFLDPSFVMAHYSLLGIAISEGSERERARNLRNLRGILLEMAGNDVIPHGDGATAKDLLSALTNLQCEVIKIRQDISAILIERAKNLAIKGNLGYLDRGDEFVTFRLGGETYGISSDLVGEVFPAREVTALPGVPSFILGIVNVRGKIVSVNDLRAILDLPDSPDSDRFILVLRSKSMEMGLWVEPPVDVMTTPPHSLDPPIPSSSSTIEYISGIYKDVVILNGDRILSTPSLVVKEVLQIREGFL